MNILTYPWESPVLKNFFVFEGLDGAGTTTQAHKLAQYCKAEFTCEPTDSHIGKSIRIALQDGEYTTPHLLSFLFAADRMHHLEHPQSGIKRKLASGTAIVCDRYLFSSLAYQGSYIEFQEVERINCNFPLPEHLIYIDILPHTANNRLRHRPARDQLEHIEILERVYQTYNMLLDDFSQLGVMVHRIDGTQSIEAVFQSILASLNIPADS